MREDLFIIRFILAHDKANAAFQFISDKVFLKVLEYILKLLYERSL